MRTDDLTARLHDATADQPFTPAVGPALARARDLRRRRRTARMTGSLAVLTVAGAAGFASTAYLNRPDTVQGQFAQGAPAAGIRVERDTGPDIAVACALQVVVPGIEPGTIGFPCGAEEYVGTANTRPVGSRQDRVTLDDRDRYVTSGTAPAGAVSVTAVDAAGKPLTAVLRTPDFADVTVWVFITDDDLVADITYTLSDDTQGPPNTVYGTE